MEYLTANGEIIERRPVFWKTPHNHDTDAEAHRTGLACKDPSLAQQHMAAETDINTIVDRFLKTGEMPNIPVPPRYENFGQIFDFQSAMDAIKAATDSFMALPANIRSRFDNDPAKFVGYVDHCLEMEDLEPLVKMGLAVERKPNPPATPVAGTPPIAAPAASNAVPPKEDPPKK